MATMDKRADMVADAYAAPGGRPEVCGFFHEKTGSVAYLVIDGATSRAAIIDPVLDFDENAARISTEHADALLAEVAKRKLTVEWILDTHPHADHLSAAAYLRDQLDAKTAIGERIVKVQAIWNEIYNSDVPADGSQWDRLFTDGETFQIGSLKARVMLSPGHTLASISYIIGDAVFMHDTLFHPVIGSARCDFPGGDASALYDSINAILAMPPETRLFTGHDYPDNGRMPEWEFSVARQWRENKHFKDAPAREDFVAMRTARDRTLSLPRLMLHALQFNIRGGRLPAPESGKHFFKIPVNAF